ncbi:MAG TPA: AAA family ATPase [Cyclobacteriaceae bacterium]|nr:AAA family ATPase [Cyclobacteriaceae bacterium]HRF32422.1 AAA family ATPase [Cyclobacteriaceae bacterium]
MAKIRVRDFGPIRDGFAGSNGWIDIKKVTVFVGNQGSGKSTIAKLISTCSWIEKALTRGDYSVKHFQRKNKFKNPYLKYHRLDNYFVADPQRNSEIEYRGDSYNIRYSDDFLEIEEARNGGYPLPQIMYVPSERNFISNVKSPKALKLTSDSMIDFVTEFDNAKNEMRGSLPLPINGVNVEYDKLNDIVNIKGQDYKVRLAEASSGFQSLVPVYLVSWYLANSVKRQSERSQEPMSSDELARFKKGVEAIWSDENLNDEQRRAALSVLSAKFNKTAFVNIIEEPEQNLFPSSQWQLLKGLLEFNNINPGNKLVLTTHSPYLINYLTLAVKATELKQQLRNQARAAKIDQILPMESNLKADDLVIYELDETTGTIKKLDTFQGLPSDQNYLNQQLVQSDELFAELLEIQQGA